MTCAAVRPLLPAHVYGDLPAADAAAVARHLHACPACQAEAAALAQVRAALDVTPAPAVRVDLANLFRTAADRQERRARRWRRVGVAGAALAAGLLLVVGLRVQVRVGAGQVVIEWGGAGASGGRQPPGPPANDKAPDHAVADQGADAPRSPEIPASVEDRLRLQQDLIHALAADVEARDRARRYETDDLRGRLDAVQRTVAQRWTETERWMNALYVAQFKRPEEKANP